MDLDTPASRTFPDPFAIPDRSASTTGSSGQAVPVGIGGAANAGAMLLDDPAALVRYNCGDCQAVQRFARGAMMRCTECGGRMFYKQRTKRMVQFEAR